jgi:uncharacterized protein YjbI with pentapeptide repeats
MPVLTASSVISPGNGAFMAARASRAMVAARSSATPKADAPPSGARNASVEREEQTMSDKRFEHLSLSPATFRDCNLARSTFDDCNLSAAAFINVNLAGASFSDVNLAGVTIDNANIQGLTIFGYDVCALIEAECSRDKS